MYVETLLQVQEKGGIGHRDLSGWDLRVVIENETFLNCTWVACNFGPFTLEEIGTMMGVSHERIRQIEARALMRLQQKKRKDQLRDFSDESNRN